MKYITRFLILVLVIMGAVILWTISDQNGSSTAPSSSVVPAEADPAAVAEHQDRNAPAEEDIPARTACREFLLQTLDAPEAAEFEDIAAWPMSERPEGTLEVRMSGRIQNNLGEMIDAQWRCVVLPAGNQMRLVTLAILGAGGEERSAPESSGPDTYQPDTSAWESLTGQGEADAAPGAEGDAPAESTGPVEPSTEDEASDAAFPAPEEPEDN